MIASLPKGGLFSFLPSLDRVGIEWAALGFAIGASICAGVMAGLFPAFAARRVDLIAGLKDIAAIDSPRARTILVTAEIALSVTLLAGAGLLLKTMQRVGAIDAGFRSDHLLTLRAPVPRGTDRVHAESYYRELTARLAALPGVRSAALTNAQPLTGTHRVEPFEIPGQEGAPEAGYRVVTPGYFATLGIPMRRGRAFDARDQHRAVISESLARKYWSQADPLGQTIRVHGEAVEIIGICADTRDVLLRDAAPILYRPWRDEPDRAQQVDLRTSGDPLALARAVNGVVRDLGGVVAEMQPGSDSVEDATWQQKQSASVMSAFAAIALALAAIGLYGVISMAVGRRTREIGIRMAIGARPHDVIALVLAETARPVAIGLALGLIGALATGRLLGALLYQVTPSDPVILAAVALSIAAAAFAASLRPLRRALTIHPNTALRLD
jgi:putative ABC transport system permease protein